MRSRTIIYIFVILSLFGCKTRYITLKDVIRDSIYLTQKDTLRRVVLRSTTDTLRLHDSVTIYRNAEGGIERVERIAFRDRISIRHDTVDIYRAKYDSLAAIHAQREDVPVPVEQKRPWWRRNIVPAIVALALLILCVTVMRYTRRSRDGI